MGRRPRALDPAASAGALFGAKLRRWRETQGWTQEQLGEQVFCTGDQISKVELAKRTPSWDLAVDLDRVLRTCEAFQELWPLVNKETLPEWFRPYPELEAEAATIRIFGLALIHGLLQTEDYAREIFRTGETPEKLDQLLAARMARQEILSRREPPRLWVVLDEKAIRCPVGGAGVMRAQVAHLVELAQRPNITLQIVPDSRGAYVGLSGPITILSFGDGPDILYLEGQAGGQLAKETSTVETCGLRFELIRSSALPREESLELLTKILESL